MADVYDENACPNQTPTRQSSAKKTAKKKSNRHKICNNSNVSPIKRQTNVAKLAALYDNNNGTSNKAQYKQHLRRTPLSSAAVRQQKAAAGKHRLDFDDNIDYDGGST